LIEEDVPTRLLIAILLPWLLFFTIGRSVAELLPKVVFWLLNKAATRSISVTSTPSLNFTPVITLVK
jgi:hypothetical protein